MSESQDFAEPRFDTGELELRFEDDTVCIYGTEGGLRKLVKLCEELLGRGAGRHIHLEDYGILTSQSRKGAVAIFKQPSE